MKNQLAVKSQNFFILRGITNSTNVLQLFQFDWIFQDIPDLDSFIESKNNVGLNHKTPTISLR